MRDEEAQVKTNGVQKKEGFKYKLWVLAAILLLASWTMFTGSITLSLNWKHLSAKPDSPAIHDDLDLLVGMNYAYISFEFSFDMFKIFLN